VVVDVSHVMLDPGADGSPALRVGQRVERGRTRLGTVVDLGGALQPVLRRYVSDSGNNVAVELDPAPSVSIP
jgi:hypothetical protein